MIFSSLILSRRVGLLTFLIASGAFSVTCVEAAADASSTLAAPAGAIAMRLPAQPPLKQVITAPPTPTITLQLTPQDGMLSKALAGFATQHGWSVSWELDRDFPIDFAARFEGSFLKIVEQVAVALQSSETPIRVKAYHGNHVLRVMAATQ